MKPANYQLPTLGQFTKVLCDCLGLWSSNGIDVEFHVPASEKARREALRSAFELIKKTMAPMVHSMSLCQSPLKSHQSQSR